MHRSLTGVSAGLGLAALAFLLAGPSAHAQQANYQLPKEPTAQVGSTYFYTVPMGFTYDMFAYLPNGGDWSAISDHAFDAGEIPGNPTFCGADGSMCPTTAGGAMSTSFIAASPDPHNDPNAFASVPILIGPTQDGFNNVQDAFGQAIPVVPGHYTGVYVANTQVNGPRTKMLALNYTDGSVVSSLTWADWCNAAQAPGDVPTWHPTHRINGSGADNNSCGLVTKFVSADPNRVLTSITVGEDNVSGTHGGGEELPGDTITTGNGRTAIGGITLSSTDPKLGGYGFVSGHFVDSTGKVLTTPANDGSAQPGYDVFVLSPALGNYGAGANIDGSYTLGLPAGTYTLSAAVRDGSNPSAGPQAAPVTVTVTAGQTTKQDITIAASPTPNTWGELKGIVKDASGNPVQGVAILFSDSMTGPFAAKGIPDPDAVSNGAPGMPEGENGLTIADGAYDIRGLNATKPIFVEAEGNGYATASPMMVTLNGGAAVSQDLTVAVQQIGNITGTLQTPDKQFGGTDVQVTLTGKNLTLTTTTFATPALNGTGRVPETGEMATFQFTGVPAGSYMLTLPASAVQGAAVSTPVTVTAGQTVTPSLTITYPAWTEGTPDTTISDPLTGTSLASAWTAADQGAPSAKGSAAESSSGLTVTADGTGWDASTVDDAFNYVYKTIPAGNWVAYVTVTKVPTNGTTSSSATSISPGGQAGLMVGSSIKAAPRMANVVVSATNNEGVAIQSRLADGSTTFPFGETAANTDQANGGKQPGLPIILKLRKVGPDIAGFYSTDGGKTQSFVGNVAPQLDPTASLVLGLATTSNTDGTTDTGTYTNFVFAPLAPAAPAASPSTATNPAPAAGQ